MAAPSFARRKIERLPARNQASKNHDPDEQAQGHAEVAKIEFEQAAASDPSRDIQNERELIHDA
jgi:hypothetical protein